MVSVQYLLKRLVYWIQILNTYRYIIINCSHVQFRVKSTNYYGSYGPFSTLKNGFHSIPFEKISVLDSFFGHRYLIIKHKLDLG